MAIPSYLNSKCAAQDPPCYGCEEATKQNPMTGRWYITIGHPGFNTKANNGKGYKTEISARIDLDWFAARRSV